MKMLRITNVPELPENPLEKWREQFEENNLSPSDLKKFFYASSPCFFNLEKSSDANDLGKCSFDEGLAKVVIIDAIEEFMCGEDPQNVFKRLKTENHFPSVCGRVFRSGEATYSCRECGTDPTCVLCSSCFKQSAHRHHKYRMSASSGGGYCDCGDTEAWKTHPFCDEHVLGLENKDESSIINDTMKKRCNLVFEAVLQYCMKCLEVESNASLLGLDGAEDIYCTILYNDESHTYEQVIQTLTRVVKCVHKDAVEYVTSIDREGRAVVRSSKFQECMRLKDEIEKFASRPVLSNRSAPLNVGVLHKNCVAFQQFALQLLGWFQQFLKKHAIFRQIFCDIATKDNSFITHILLNDCKLWKTARVSWHRLLISGMMMEYEHKKTFAVIFSKLYTNLMQEFIRDDHEHSYCVVALSVQFFTVPTIAHYLIAYEDACFKLMHTFYSECIEKYVVKKVLQFTKNTAHLNVFKRASHVLYDIKYLLNIKPDEWTDSLKRGFLHGVQTLLRLLNVMQGMDSVFRQTGQHMEYEPEWETAFNLHIKLASIITLVIDWCSMDKVVLIKVYRMVLAHLSDSEFIISQTKIEVKELADHSTSCFMYDVASKPVSIHLPLSRLFAGLYLHLEKFGLTFDNITTNTAKPTPEQIIEPVLCTQTMIAQVHSGLWRRNGYSLLNQLHFYRNVRCRSEMLDRDVIVLQIGASLIESNEFLIHIMNKFNLIDWASPDFEKGTAKEDEDDGMIRTVYMIDEFLELLIVIIGERYMCGVGKITEEDRIRKEIIQQLCIKPFSHSELSRALPDISSNMGIEAVVDSVAEFKKPTQPDKKGFYVLKDEFYDHYNMYFYHYTKEDKSISEEAQRKRKKEKNEKRCCPPPKLPQLSASFHMMANLLQCDVMLLVMQTVLKRSLDLNARSFSEGHLQKVLHIIGYAIHEQMSNFYPFLTFHDRANKWGLLQLMEDLVNNPRVEAHRDLLLWTVQKYKEMQNVASGENVDTTIEATREASPTTSSETEKAEKKERARLAAERRAKILAQMQVAQHKFLTVHADLFDEKNTADEDEVVEKEEECDMEWNDNENSIACLGPNKRVQSWSGNEEQTCILCSCESKVSKDDDCMVYSAYIQKSSVLSRYQKTNENGQLLYLETAIHPSPHTSTCGHVMHASCWQEYFNNELVKENRRPYRNRPPGNFDIEKKEFLCPLCRCISNAVLPMSPELRRFYIPTAQNVEVMKFDLWMDIMKEYSLELKANADILNEPYAPAMPLPLADVLKKFDKTIESFHKLSQPEEDEAIGLELTKYIQTFMESVRRIAPYPASFEETEPFLVTWLSCAYTIESLEMLLRALDKPLKGNLSIRHTACLSGLVRLCGLMGASSKTIAPKLVLQMCDLYDTVFARSGMSVLSWDIFGMLLSLLYITPCTIYNTYGEQKKISIPKGDMLEYYILKLMFLANMARIVIVFEKQGEKMEVENLEDESPGEGPSKAESPSKVLDFYNKHKMYNNTADEEDSDGAKSGNNLITAKSLIDEVKLQSITFLRCACLLFNFMTDIEMPEEFGTLGCDTFEIMCEYLGLSASVESYFNDAKMYEYMEALVTHPDVLNFRKDLKSNAKDLMVLVMAVVPPIRQLVTLPDDYCDLINSVSLFTCPNFDRDDSRNPTMCLVCGEVLCSQTYCCQKELNGTLVGACTYHADVCGAGVGVFLRIRDCELLLIGLNKGCFLQPPYLDEYGETDQGLRRGNPLHLCKQRYKKLHLSWLGHNLHEEIARLNESQNTLGQTPWHHL